MCDIQSWFQVPSTVPAMQARCDMDSEDGGWMIILRRKADVSEQVNFIAHILSMKMALESSRLTLNSEKYTLPHN